MSILHKNNLEQPAGSLKVFCKSQLDLSLMSSQCCVSFQQSKKNRPKTHQQDQIYSRDACPPNDSEPVAWTATEQHSWGYTPTTFSTSYNEKVSKYHQKRKNWQELSNFFLSVSTSYWQLGIEHLLLHVILSCINLLEPGHLKHAVGCVSREARSHALEGTPSCFQPWSKFEHIH